MTQFKIGDYAINDNYGVVFPIRDKWSKDIINAQKDYRHANEEEIEQYEKGVNKHAPIEI